MESHVITVEEQSLAESISKGLSGWFNCDPSVRAVEGGWGVYVGGIVPENARLLMNHYGLGVLDAKTGKV
jgi:hypothetical protein